MITGLKITASYTVSTRHIETTIFDPASEFLNFLYLVYLLYCYFTNLRESRLQFISASFYVPSTDCNSRLLLPNSQIDLNMLLPLLYSWTKGRNKRPYSVRSSLRTQQRKFCLVESVSEGFAGDHSQVFACASICLRQAHAQQPQPSWSNDIQLIVLI